MSRAVHAGMLDRRVRFEQATRTDDGLGGVTVLWVSAGERWAYVETLGGSDSVEADERVSKVNLRVIIRRDESIHAGMRCVIAGDPHRIEWVAPYGTDRMFTECRVFFGGATS